MIDATEPSNMPRTDGFATLLDAGILARAQRGEAQAFETIYRTYQRPAFALAWRMLGRRAIAEDVVHDCFLRSIEKLHQFRGDSPFGIWLKRMLVHLAIDRLRSEQRWQGDADEVDLLAEELAHPDHQIDAMGLLARLPDRARTVVWLHQMEGYAHVEIAALFKQSESWSKSTLARSLERLRQCIQGQETT